MSRRYHNWVSSKVLHITPLGRSMLIRPHESIVRSGPLTVLSIHGHTFTECDTVRLAPGLNTSAYALRLQRDYGIFILTLRTLSGSSERSQVKVTLQSHSDSHYHLWLTARDYIAVRVSYSEFPSVLHNVVLSTLHP